MDYVFSMYKLSYLLTYGRWRRLRGTWILRLCLGGDVARPHVGSVRLAQRWEPLPFVGQEKAPSSNSDGAIFRLKLRGAYLE